MAGLPPWRLVSSLLFEPHVPRQATCGAAVTRPADGKSNRLGSPPARPPSSSLSKSKGRDTLPLCSCVGGPAPLLLVRQAAAFVFEKQQTRTVIRLGIFWCKVVVALRCG